jgi:hypothetical protein
MARINIEDILFEDPRFFELSVKLGSKETALGALILAWRIAQKHYTKDYKYIPIDVWNKLGLKNEIIDTGLATANDRFIRMAGCDDQFGWLRQRVEAGKKGGKNRKSAKNLKSNTIVNSLATANGSQENSSDRLASYLSSLNSNTLSSSQFDILKYQCHPDKQKFVDVLKKFDQDKNFKLYLPHLIFRFEAATELEEFLNRIDASKTVGKIGKEDAVKAKNYITVALKNEIGVKTKNENT